MTPTIGLGIIAKATKEEAEQLDRLLANVAPHVQEIQLTVTGHSEEVEAVGKKYGAELSYYKWHDDFAAARNYNLSKIKSPWYLWLDCDDTLDKPEKLKSLVLLAEEKMVAAFAFKYHYHHNAHGICDDMHWKVQLLKNDGHFTWRGRIHEDPSQLTPSRWTKTDDIIRVHHSNDERTKESYERNLRILLAQAEDEKQNPDPRTLFYLGRTYIATGDLQTAVDYLRQYLTLSGWDEERYEATLLIGQALVQSGKLDEALEVYNAAILEKEEYPDAYIQKGMCYLKKRDWAKAVVTFSLARQFSLPDANTYFNPLNYTLHLLHGLAIAEMNLGKLDRAWKSICEALKHSPKDEKALATAGLIKQLRDKHGLAVKFLELARELKDRDEKKILPLLSAVPAQIADDERILALRFTYQKPQTWPERSIAIYCGPTVEEWYPGAENTKGIGGSETAVIELSKRLAKKGWKITVYNSCNAPPEGMDIEGVHYENYWKFNVKDQFDVLWIWRLPEMFDFTLQARKKILDLHDTMTPHDLTPSRVERIDAIFVKSHYHRSLYPKVADDKFVIVGNGIDLSRFVGDKTKEPYRFAYTSTPNRGLDILLEHIWPKIRIALPDATLHVYYGWKTFYEIEKNNPERMKWMRKVQDLMKQPGVVDHGRVGQKALAQDLMKTNFWLYPTYFPEIYCITACEMQAAGVIPITSGYAALAETQKGGITLDGDVYDPEWQDTFAKEAVYLAKNPTAQKTVRELTLKESSQFDWELVANEWDSRLK